ncbi:transaldolase family protein [Escherichia coli]
MVMELYLDASDIIAVKALSRIFPLAGVTTNPSIIAAAKTAGCCASATSPEAMGGPGASVFAQVMASTAEGMVNDARKLRSIIADMVVKVPVTSQRGWRLLMLKAEGDSNAGNRGIWRSAGCCRRWQVRNMLRLR